MKLKLKLAPPKSRRSIAVKFRTGAGAHQKPAKALRQQGKAALRREIKAGAAHINQATFHIGSAMQFGLSDMTSRPVFECHFEQALMRKSFQPCQPPEMRFTLM